MWQDRQNFNENDKIYLPVLATELQAELQEFKVGRTVRTTGLLGRRTKAGRTGRRTEVLVELCSFLSKFVEDCSNLVVLCRFLSRFVAFCCFLSNSAQRVFRI